MMIHSEGQGRCFFDRVGSIMNIVLKSSVEKRLGEAHVLGKIDSAKASLSEAARSASQLVMPKEALEAFLEWIEEARTDLDEAVKNLPNGGKI